MSEFIGIIVPSTNSLKREALIFDRLGIFDLNHYIKFLRMAEPLKWLADDIEWLQENNIVFGVKSKLPSDKTIISKLPSELLDFTIESTKNQTNEMGDLKLKWSKLTERINKTSNVLEKSNDLDNSGIKKNSKAFETDHYNYVLKSIKSLENASIWPSRIMAIVMSEIDQSNAIPAIPRHYRFPKESLTKNTEIINLVVNRIPVPDENIPWSHILEFRSDPESKRKYWAIRKWITEISKAELSTQEIEEQIEFLIAEYEAHMRLHKMKFTSGVLETVVTAGAEILENLVKFKWSNAAKSLFSIRKQKINLLEAELKSPGSEVAYIVKTKDTFGSK